MLAMRSPPVILQEKDLLTYDSDVFIKKYARFMNRDLV